MPSRIAEEKDYIPSLTREGILRAAAACGRTWVDVVASGGGRSRVGRIEIWVGIGRKTFGASLLDAARRGATGGGRTLPAIPHPPRLSLSHLCRDGFMKRER